ncbi:MAG: glycosyltransferase family 4 protein [Treponema sp.]|nr:glycosyltransferase family 4 protein [Treponema sp.]
MILINGDFFCRRLTGIERYAYEITIRLDKLCKPGEIAIVIPSYIKNLPEYKNLKVIRLKKKGKNIIWQMMTLQYFLLIHKKYTVLEFGNNCLPFTPGIVFLHDIYCELFPKDFTSIRDKFTMLYSRIQYRFISYLAKRIITVSESSKKEIINKFRINQDKIDVIYSNADHMKKIKSDTSVFTDFPILNNKQYYYFLGSLSKRKNLQWIIKYAKKNPEDYFAISGTSLLTVKIKELDAEIPKNIILLGYLNDSKVKALMEKCKAFILPSYYEGFGLTPLEALSCGVPIIISNASSLPEIYGNTAHYIDPFNTDVDLNQLLKEPVDNPDEILSKYSSDKAATMLYDVLKEYIN